VTLPLQLPVVSAGFARLSRSAREIGVRAAEAAATALSSMLGHPVRIAGDARPSLGGKTSVGCEPLAIALDGLGERALLEVDARLAAAAADLLAGGTGHVAGALALTSIERAVLELLTLVALDGARSIPEVAALGPRLTTGASATATESALAIELDLEVGPLRGRARLLAPPAAVAASGRASAAPEADAGWSVTASLRRGGTALLAEELAALAPGDVVLVEGDAARLVLPGGCALAGTLEDDRFTLEEVLMDGWTATCPIALSVELARVTIPLGELVRVERGGVLPLHVGRDGAVTLRAGEHPVARGQLVEVDGAIGVRIDVVEVRP
jgi:type III secretion protein Q